MDRQALVLAALSEGTPINSVCRMFGLGINSCLRIIEETGEALAHYMNKRFTGLPCSRIEVDEQWQYVGKHGQRMAQEEPGKGDFWLWCAIDPDTKLVFSHRIGKRDWQTAEDFIGDCAEKTVGEVQICSDGLRAYERAIRYHFGSRASYGIEQKEFKDPLKYPDPNWPRKRMNGVEKIVKAHRKAVFGHVDFKTLTTCHIERNFLTVRQQLTRFTRMTLAYSKSLRMHRLAVSLHFGLYNLCRKHTSLEGKTPAQAAKVETKRWTLEDVVVLTEAYWKPKREFEQAAKALKKREAEDAVFLAALAEMEG